MLQEGALAGLKVVELSDQISGQVAGSFCARLLGDAGADVVKVESLQGDPYRRIGPYPGGVPDPDWSGLFLYLNSNKRGVSLDIESPGGRAAFLELVAAADFLMLGQNSSEVERLGLRREQLSEANPSLIVTTITPFGLTGPNSAYLGAGLLIAAGIYQWLPLKESCLRQCRSPVEFISTHMRQGTLGALRMGIDHGLSARSSASRPRD